MRSSWAHARSIFAAETGRALTGTGSSGVSAHDVGVFFCTISWKHAAVGVGVGGNGAGSRAGDRATSAANSAITIGLSLSDDKHDQSHHE